MALLFVYSKRKCSLRLVLMRCRLVGERVKVLYFGKAEATGLDKSHKSNEINLRKCVIWLPMG